MKKLPVFSAIIPLVIFLSISVNAAQFSFSADDNSSTVDTPMGLWAPDGSVADIAYNQNTGDLYAFTLDGVYQHGIINKVYTGSAAFNSGGDIAVGPNGEFALSPNDTWGSVILIGLQLGISGCLAAGRAYWDCSRHSV